MAKPASMAAEMAARTNLIGRRMLIFSPDYF
jgi:hypothetical protein